MCLIDTSADKPEGAVSKKEDKSTEAPKVEEKNSEPAAENKTYATGTASPAAKKILAEKDMSAGDVVGTGKDGRVTKEDAVTVDQDSQNTQSTHTKYIPAGQTSYTLKYTKM